MCIDVFLFAGTRMAYREKANLAEREKRILGREENRNHQSRKSKSVGQGEKASVQKRMEIVQR